MILRMALYRFRASLSESVGKAARGSTIILTRHGKPIAEVRPAGSASGSWQGVNVLPAKTRRMPRVRPFQGPGTMSREILEERRRNG
jgi:antitoxin (DNA-binding transcriptional repressor) of toxin-antitoxin stability system